VVSASRLESIEHPKPGWIVLLLVSLLISWPIGLLLLVILLLTGRLDGWKRAALALWQDITGSTSRPSGTWWQPSRSSGNEAFDEYRAETLRRLEDEEKEFAEFLERLRAAKDKSEFDQFMADRRNRTHSSVENR
jgi:hypothetical protein